MTHLVHLSESRLEELRGAVPSNIQRYIDGGFSDFRDGPGWRIELDVRIEIDGLRELDGTDNSAEADLRNSFVVMNVLGQLSPSLANEERIWVRLSHVEAFEYARRRWLQRIADRSTLARAIETHFFARTQTGLRDDHAVSRLWWNGYLAKACYPEDPRRGLELMLRRADVRSNIVERIWLTGRRPLARAVFRAMDSDPFVLSTEASFREFMKALNIRGAGIVFEAMLDAKIDGFVRGCIELAQERLALKAAA